MNPTCAGCGQIIEVDAPKAQVGRRNGSTVDIFYLHLHCYEDKHQEYYGCSTKLPDGFSLPEPVAVTKDRYDKEDMTDQPKVAQHDTSQAREQKAEEYKRQAVKIFHRAQEEKDGGVWLNLVNNPACYYAVRHIMSLKGVSVTVEQFEELSASFIILIREATQENIKKSHNAETTR